LATATRLALTKGRVLMMQLSLTTATRDVSLTRLLPCARPSS
jgi:hypothetical protein